MLNTKITAPVKNFSKKKKNSSSYAEEENCDFFLITRFYFQRDSIDF